MDQPTVGFGQACRPVTVAWHRRISRGLIAAILSAPLAGPAFACLACIEMPSESLADKAGAADAVGLLRPDPADPFRFVVIAWLKGGAAGAPVPFLVSRTRAAELAADPGAAVVATWSDGPGWAMHDAGSAALAAALADLLARDLSTPEARRDAFGPLVGHDDPAVARMALIELASLPYGVLRTTQAGMDRARVARMVADPLWSEWAPVAILLLGMSDAPADRAFVRRAAGLAAETGRAAHLAAWLTALIEVDGMAALDLIRAGWLAGPGRPEEDLRQVGLALASHAGRTDATGDAIRAAAGELAARHPAVAAALVRTMTERRDWSLAAEAARWLDEGRVTSPSDAFLLNAYVLAAAETETPG